MVANHRTKLRTGLLIDVNTSGIWQTLLLFLSSNDCELLQDRDWSCSCFVAGVLPSKGPFIELIHSNCLPIAAVIPSSQPLSPSTPLVSQGVNNFLMGEVRTLILSSSCFHMEAHLLPEFLKGEAGSGTIPHCTGAWQVVQHLQSLPTPCQ